MSVCDHREDEKLPSPGLWMASVTGLLIWAPACFTQSGDYLLRLTDSADIHKPKSEPQAFSHLVSCDLKPLTISAGCESADMNVIKSSSGVGTP